MDEQSISKCGIVCTDCPAFIAREKNDDRLREKTARQWSEQFGVDLPPSAINCYGCHYTGKEKLFAHCTNCEIRLCALEKELSTCAGCDDFGCDKLQEVWKFNSSIKANLEGLRKNL